MWWCPVLSRRRVGKSPSVHTGYFFILFYFIREIVKDERAIERTGGLREAHHGGLGRRWSQRGWQEARISSTELFVIGQSEK